ncbi:phosphatase RsbU N-terminal domain-containing protein [Paenibacillus glycanilyticus]|uniref:phosphatase RsbU N-terminal domain-containing protein n=1 Tax=Paenibacillus glycanilyticus TaxID=126569 RepID=UPI0035A23EC2
MLNVVNRCGRGGLMMHSIRKRYFPALAEYIRGGEEQSLYKASELGKDIKGFNPEEIIAVHEESIQYLAANVESEEALKLYNQSFMFLIEVMVAHRMNEVPAETVEQKFSDMRERLFLSNRSFEMVKHKYENVLQHMDSGIALFDSDGFCHLSTFGWLSFWIFHVKH